MCSEEEDLRKALQYAEEILKWLESGYATIAREQLEKYKEKFNGYVCK